MTTDEIPARWAESRLRDIVHKLVDGSHNPPPKQNSGLPMLSAINIRNNAIDFSDRHRLIAKDAFAEEDQRTSITPGDVLLTIVGAIGRAALVPTNSQKFAIQRSVAVLGSTLIDPKFLMYQLEAPRFATYLKDNARGTAQKGVYLNTLGQAPTWIAPINEQRRIVAKIEELFSELDKGIEALEQTRRRLDLYRTAVLNQAVRDSKGCLHPKRLLDDVIGEIGQGWSPKCDLNRPPGDLEWAIIKTTAVQPMSYLPDECKPLPGGLEPRDSIVISDGDLLMTRKGPRPRTGVVCYVKRARPYSMLCDTVYRFRTNEYIVVPEYLEIALNSPSVVQEIDSKKSGISESGISLNHGRIRSVSVPIPQDKGIQHHIVQVTRQRLSVADHLNALIDEQVQKSVAVRQSILKKAFSGQLVAQDPKDEPASALLERIRTERDGAPTTKTRKRQKRAEEQER